MTESDLNWPAMQSMECTICKEERDCRNRVMARGDFRVRREPLLSAPFIHTNNESQCHAMLLRAHEQATHTHTHTENIQWFAAVDTLVTQLRS